MDIQLYDTTLRDGTQGKGMQLSLEDKLQIAKRLDAFGMAYIEGGWPGSNPKDGAFFEQAAKLSWEKARLVAFGATRRAGIQVEEDANLQALLDAKTPVVALVGKAWDLHVDKVLGISNAENLQMIRDSIRYMKAHGKEVVFDAEHFFDGFRHNPAYALAVARVAEEAGADWLVLCDTNGGSLPDAISHVTWQVAGIAQIPLGIHAHNDAELAAANSLAAVGAGATMVQGTVNGFGERCGNANLVSLIPTLQLKLAKSCIPHDHLSQLTSLAHYVAEVANVAPNPHAAYVGNAAFAHKGGIHVAAVAKLAQSYEHIDPSLVGNQRQIVISELSGRRNIRLGSEGLGMDVAGQEAELLQRIKDLEFAGYQFENAEASFALLALRNREENTQPPFEMLEVRTLAEKRGHKLSSEAVIKVKVNQHTLHVAAVGNGPVHALDQALRKALLPDFPHIGKVRLTDYKVRILNAEAATGAGVRVLVEAATDEATWRTVGVSTNIIAASCEALCDSFEWYLRQNTPEPALCASPP